MKQARRDLPKIIDEKVTPEPDKEESMLKGNKVNAYLYRKKKKNLRKETKKSFLKKVHQD